MELLEPSFNCAAWKLALREDAWERTVTQSLAPAKAYEIAGLGAGDLDLLERHDCFATAELVHYDNLMLCEEGGATDFSTPAHPGRTAARRSASPRAWSPGGIRSRQPGSPTSGRSRPTCGARPARGRLTGPGLTYVIGTGQVCAIHILERSAA